MDPINGWNLIQTNLLGDLSFTGLTACTYEGNDKSQPTKKDKSTCLYRKLKAVTFYENSSRTHKYCDILASKEAT